MKIAIFSGSARPQRQSHQVAVELKRRLEKRNLTPWMFDVREQGLPLLDNTFRASEEPNDQLKQLSHSIVESDAILIVSPEHNGSYSGALKNSMDYFYKEYFNKVFGLVGVSAGMLGGINCIRSLQHYALSLNGIIYPSYLLTPKVQNLFENGKLTDEAYAQRLEKFLDGFLQLAQDTGKHKGES